MLNKMIRSIIDQDRASIVICDLEHIIVYMNPAAILNYEKRGGKDLIGKSLLNCHNLQSKEMIEKVVNWFLQSPTHNMIHTFYNEKQDKDVYMVALRDGEKLIGYYEKHEYRTKETAAIYDFSHPIK